MVEVEDGRLRDFDVRMT